MGSLNLLEALRSADSLKMAILISSAEVYGRVPEARMPICEEQEWCPTNPYSSSKACVELMGVQYYNTHGLPIVRMRPFNHIGAGQSETFVASSFAKQIAEIEGGLRPPQIVVGNLEAARDFTDVRDITRAYLLAADRCRVGDVYNLCSGKAVTIKSLLDGLLSLTNVSVEVAQDPARMRGSDVPVQVGSCAKFSSFG
jgi:GDP-4-dehydro-6-deoxy-D-mannose reductase